MKNLILIILVTLSVQAKDIYFGLGGTITLTEVEYNVPKSEDDCKAYAYGLIGYNFNSDYSIETRVGHIMRGDAKIASVLGIKNFNENFYGLVGVEKSFDLPIDNEYGADIGIGYRLLGTTINSVGFEVMYKTNIKSMVINAQFKF